MNTSAIWTTHGTPRPQDLTWLIGRRSNDHTVPVAGIQNETRLGRDQFTEFSLITALKPDCMFIAGDELSTVSDFGEIPAG
jgi:hypothetical protein